MIISRRSFMATFAGAAALGGLPISASTISPTAIPSGPSANVTGLFGPVIDWPIIPIHVVLLPENKVMSYGTDTAGNQTGQFNFAVWDPALGVGPDSHLILPNTTFTDIFCSSQSVMGDGKVLIAGGDRTVNGKRNYSIDATNIFDPETDVISSTTRMNAPRWYPSLVSLPNELKVIFGGRNDPGAPLPITPEIRTTTNTWRSLTGAASSIAFGNPNNWYYPRAHVLPGGKVGVLTNDGLIFSVDTSGMGSIRQVGQTAFPGTPSYPTISYAPGKWFSMRQDLVNITIDFNSTGAPIVTRIANMDQVRKWANATIMADGKVFVNGGAVANSLSAPAYKAIIWDPETTDFTDAASAQRTRLYHSTALLLPDATVWTGGGGAPGPEVNLNAEIFYPPYLYTSQGQPAERPTLTNAPAVALLGRVVSGTIGTNDQIARVTLVRTGSTTHSYNSDQRFLELDFKQDGQHLMVMLPKDPSIVVPGYWMMFAWNRQGVPSTASVVRVKIK
jgi:hypothetical protein